MHPIRRTTSVVLAALGLVAAGSLATPAQAADPIRVPFMESFSGAAADWGKIMFQGALAGQDMINAAGGIHGRPLEFYKADAPYDDLPTAVTMFKKLGRDPGVPIILDVGAGTVVKAVHDLADKYEVPMYAFSSGGRWKQGFNKWTFRSLPQDWSTMPVLMPLLKKKFNVRKAALVWSVDDEAMVARANAMRNAAKEHGIELVEVTAKGKETDYSAQVTRINAAGVDLIFTAQQPFDGGIMVRQARDVGMNQPIVAGPGASHPDYKKMAGDAVNNTFFVGMWDPTDPKPYVQNIIAAYKKRYDEDPSTWSAISTDAALQMAKIMNSAKDLSRESIREAFSKTKSIESVSGNIGWEGSGEAIRSGIIVVAWLNGEIVNIREDFWQAGS